MSAAFEGSNTSDNKALRLDVAAQLLTPREAAALLRCSPKALRFHVAAGGIRYVAIGHGERRSHRMFLKQHVEALVSELRAKSAPTSLYRHFDASGRLLYVGISFNAISRLAQHKNGSRWFRDIARVEIEHFDIREEAARAEAKAIVTENPLHNAPPKVVS